jgi:hypothetical protein
LYLIFNLKQENIMAKTSSNFKLSKDTKRILATRTNSAEKNLYKQLMIDAENSYIVNRNRRSINKVNDTAE